MEQAGTVLDYAPDLAEQVRDGDLTLNAAYTQADKNRDAEHDRAAERANGRPPRY